MNDPAIRVENLGKLYRIGSKEGYKTFRETLVDAAKAPFLRVQEAWSKGSHSQPQAPSSTHAEGISPLPAPRSPLSSHDDFIWALKNVSFEVQRGEVVGIIGRNGAGKSTLLKILSRITEPTEGRVVLRGRVGSLLEVGTGFHSELTGEENIYLSGTILGMSSDEISRKFDEIVAFAEMEKFIHTPVKHYSSGMYMRLAFAVAAYLEPEILIVDEVLAVGDAAFQKKCLGKMGEVAKGGRTVLFVSHNMSAIRQLCKSAIWLNEGMICANGRSEEMVERYLQDLPQAETLSDIPTLIRHLPPDPAFRLHSIAISQNGLPIKKNIVNGQPLELKINYEVLHRVSGLRVYFDLSDEYDDILIRSYNDSDVDEIPVMQPGCYVSKVEIPANFLSHRKYKLIVRGTIHNVRSCTPGGITIPLTVVNNGRLNRAYFDEPQVGKLAPILQWYTTTLLMHEGTNEQRNI